MKRQPKQILVIDDEPTTVRMAEKMLTNDGYDVISAKDGFSGFALAKEAVPDLILLDILLPDIDGVELARKLLADKTTQNIPIVFMTVTIKLEDDKGSQTVNVNGHVFPGFAKPIHRRKTLSVIRREINKKLNPLNRPKDT